MMNNELIPTPMMSFGESVKTCFQKYVTFKGRARRSEYWWFCLLNCIVSIVTLVLDYQMDTINIELGLGALSGLYTLIVFLPGLAVSVRRLHDTGHSGWLYLLIIIPILGSLFLLYFFVSDSAREGAADDLAIHQRYHLSAALLLLGTEGEELSQGVGAH